MTNPWQFWDAPTIARIIGCPLDAVTRNWPLIADALERRGIYTRDVCLGVLPTVAIETASTFEPIHEYGNPSDWAGYEGGALYAGRGFPQLTHIGNYRAAGKALGLDLVGTPALALEPRVSADILAWFWDTKGVPAKDGSRFWTMVQLCQEHDWEWVRRVFQGGTDGLDRLIAMASALDAYKEATVPKVTYNPAEPPHAQEHDYDCSQDSLEWALWSVGRKPTDGWLEGAMIAEGVMSEEQGLLDASGAGLADFVRRQYGEFGFDANNETLISFDALAAEIGPYPMLIGGRAWGHWSGLKAYDRARDVLLLANPAEGYKGVGQTMNRQQFAALGPFSMVRVLHPDLLGAPAPVPVPPPAAPPPPPSPTAAITRADLDAVIASLTALRDRVPA